MNEFKAPALGKGLDIIDLIHEEGPLSFVELQKRTKDNPASLSRYLQTLTAKNYLIKNAKQKYELGLKLISLTDNQSIFPKLNSESLNLMRKIENKYGVTTLLIAYMGNQCVALEKVINLDNLGMMSKNSVFTNNIYTIWSNCFYSLTSQSDLDRLYNHLLEDEKKHLSKNVIDNIFNFINKNDYMLYRTDEKQIHRMGFPIRYMGKVIGTFGTGSFYYPINNINLDQMIEDIKTGISQIESNIQQ